MSTDSSKNINHIFNVYVLKIFLHKMTNNGGYAIKPNPTKSNQTKIYVQRLNFTSIIRQIFLEL